MTPAIFDHVVIGASALARLLAGLLAGEHARRVLFVGESQSGYRLPRGVDLSVAPVTRPETWALLTNGVAETLRLAGRIGGRGAFQHIDPIFFAATTPAVEALSHARHMAGGFGVTVEPAPSSLVGASRQGVIVRDAIRLNPAVLEPALDRWMEAQGVVSSTPDSVSVAMDGSAVLAVGTARIEARNAVLTDSGAIIAHLPLRQWTPLLQRIQTATLLTTPTQPLAAPVMVDLDSGATLVQQPEGGIAGIGHGDLAVVSRRMQDLLGTQRQVELAGQTAYPLLATADGAPAFGRAAGQGADVVAGLGAFGAFLAPALARWLAGKSSAVEADWFGQRLINRSAVGAPVADYHPGIRL